KRPDFAVTVNYGQHAAASENNAAAYICNSLSISHQLVDVSNLRNFGTGKMAGSPQVGIAPEEEWWAFRNQLLITLAAIVAIKVEANVIQIGSVKTDVQFSDGGSPFRVAISSLLAIQEGGIKLEAPAGSLTSAELVRESRVPMSLLAIAHSCHSGNIS